MDIIGMLKKATMPIAVALGVVVIQFAIQLVTVLLPGPLAMVSVLCCPLNLLLGVVGLLAGIGVGFVLAKEGFDLVNSAIGGGVSGLLVGLTGGILNLVVVAITAFKAGNIVAGIIAGVFGIVLGIVVGPIVGLVIGAILGAIGAAVKIYIMK